MVLANNNNQMVLSQCELNITVKKWSASGHSCAHAYPNTAVEEQRVWLEGAHRISRWAGRYFLIFLPQGCEEEVPTKVLWCRYNWLRPQWPLSFSHLLVIIFFNNPEEMESDEIWCSHKTKGVQCQHGFSWDGTGQNAWSAFLLKLQWQRGQFLSHTYTHRGQPASRDFNLASILLTNKRRNVQILSLTYLNHWDNHLHRSCSNIDEAFRFQMKRATVFNNKWRKLIILTVELLF